MRVAVFGLGYSGLATAITLADAGYEVLGFDVNSDVIDNLEAGKCIIHEPGFEEAVQRLQQQNRLKFHPDTNPDSWSIAMDDSMLVFICVGTSLTYRGTLDLDQVASVFKVLFNDLRHNDKCPHHVFIRSTLSVDAMGALWMTNPHDAFASFAILPEFFQEGRALLDANKPNRLVVGTANKTLDDLHECAQRAVMVLARSAPIVTMHLESAIITKLSANAFLAARVAMINEVARLCEFSDANILDVVTGLSLDPRIGGNYLKPGPGYGGYCLEKDVSSLSLSLSGSNLIDHINESNECNMNHVAKEACSILENSPSHRHQIVTIWGMGFKSGSGDIRNSPSHHMAKRLIDRGYLIQYYDAYGAEIPSSDGTRYDNALDSTTNSDLLIVMTNEIEFQDIDLTPLMLMMRTHNIYDVANSLNRDQAKDLKFNYRAFGIGKF